MFMDLFNLDFTVQEPPSSPGHIFKIIHYAAGMVGKQAVGILQKCFLVTVIFDLTGLPIMYGCICVAIFKTFSFKRLFNLKFFVII